MRSHARTAPQAPFGSVPILMANSVRRPDHAEIAVASVDRLPSASRLQETARPAGRITMRAAWGSERAAVDRCHQSRPDRRPTALESGTCLRRAQQHRPTDYWDTAGQGLPEARRGSSNIVGRGVSSLSVAGWFSFRAPRRGRHFESRSTEDPVCARSCYTDRSDFATYCAASGVPSRSCSLLPKFSLVTRRHPPASNRTPDGRDCDRGVCIHGSETVRRESPV